MALALALAAVVFAPAVANAQAPPTTTYLALGDSISFGYTAERFNIHFPTESPSYFEEGVANYFTKDLKKATEVGKTIRLVNDACPGETSNGLIGENEALGGSTSTEPSTPPGEVQGPGDFHPCAYTFEDHLPLHNGGYYNPETSQPVSQLEEAITTLTKPVAHEVKAITLNMGANDELAAIKECEKEVQSEFESKGYSFQPKEPAPGGKVYALTGKEPEDKKIEFEAGKSCIAGKAIYVTIPRIVKNTEDVLEKLDTVGGYTGPIMLMGYYNPDTFVLEGTDPLQEHANEELAKAASKFSNVTFANPFPVFNKGATEKAEQASICKYTEMCNPNVQVAGGSPAGKDGDIHPTVAGSHVLARLINEAYLANPAH